MSSIKRVFIIVAGHKGGRSQAHLAWRGHPQLFWLVFQLPVHLHLNCVASLLLLKSLVVNLKWRKQSGNASQGVLFIKQMKVCRQDAPLWWIYLVLYCQMPISSQPLQIIHLWNWLSFQVIVWARSRDFHTQVECMNTNINIQII